MRESRGFLDWWSSYSCCIFEDSLKKVNFYEELLSDVYLKVSLSGRAD